MSEAMDRARPVAAPSLQGILKALLRADFTVQLRNGRALILNFVMPLVLLYGLFASKRGSQLGNADFRVAVVLMTGMLTLAILIYSITIARDRERGVFQRLRATPAPGWTIMASRLAVQEVAILLLAVVVLVAARLLENITLSPEAYALALVVVLLSSAMFLGIGQAVVGLVKSADTVNAVAPLIYLPVLALGLFGHSTAFGDSFETVARWSPGGVVALLLSGAMQPNSWTSDTWWALVACLAYSVLFAGIGIRWFRWSTT
ncbi:MAG TPA: ABC transporter permease [Candidatus Dormibacteraeota bacterium]|nr:ABC transporter permease [Candidatus Dormibacteraeota bacterium]